MSWRGLLVVGALGLQLALSHHLAERDLLTSLVAHDPVVPAAVVALYLLRLALIVLVPAWVVRRVLQRRGRPAED